MKIRRISIQRFKSLKKVLMENIGDLIILIGANGSGKSNLLEALTLFFNELDFETTERSLGSLDNYFWFDRDDKQPIEFEVLIEFSKDEIENMLPEGSKEAYQIEDKSEVIFNRAIKGPANSALWGVTSIKLNVVAPPRKLKSIETNETEGDQEPTQTPPPTPAQTESNDLLAAISPNLLQKLKTRFIYIPSTRNASADFSGFQRRPSIVSNNILNELRSLAQNIGEYEKMIGLLDQVAKTSRTVQDVRLVGSEFTIREQGSRMQLPFALGGSGHQELIALEYRLLAERDCFFGIEEPELHSHPELVRGFLRFLKEICEDKQVFVTTHSTAFVDAVDMENVWITRKQDGATIFHMIQESSDLKMLLYELGHRPSDLFFPNAIIFVEGTSDKIAYSIWSEKLKFNFPQRGISFIPIMGKTKGRYHLEVWIEAANNTNLPFFVLLDKDAEAEAKALPKKYRLVRDKNLFTLKKGDLEEYYPDKKLISALTNIYNLQLAKDEKKDEEKEIVRSPRCENIEKLLAEKLRYAPQGKWKTHVAKMVAGSMDAGEIDDEIRAILERINSELGLEGY